MGLHFEHEFYVESFGRVEEGIEARNALAILELAVVESLRCGGLYDYSVYIGVVVHIEYVVG